MNQSNAFRPAGCPALIYARGQSRNKNSSTNTPGALQMTKSPACPSLQRSGLFEKSRSATLLEGYAGAEDGTSMAPGMFIHKIMCAIAFNTNYTLNIFPLNNNALRRVVFHEILH
jgi:hypothetical protein